MGKRSVRENKNIYQVCREENGLTREKASMLMEYVSPERIEKIESEKSAPHPDEVLAMSKCYKVPTLCNYYCTHECVIGEKYVDEVSYKELSQITLETLAALNKLEKAKTRFIEITVDGEVTEDEMPDFLKIQEELNRISSSFDSLRLWVDQTIESGKIKKEWVSD